MKTILIAALLTATLSTALPVVSAECVETYVCADAGSIASGTCDAGYAYNFVGASSFVSGVEYGYASAYTYCAGFGNYRYSRVGGSAYVTTAQTGPVYGSLWYGGYSQGSTFCDTRVMTSETGTDNFGCPVGPAPQVPALLP